MKKVLFSMVAMTLLFACSKDPETADLQNLPDPQTKTGEYLDVTPSSLAITKVYDTIYLNISSNMDWVVTSKPSFCYLPVTSGSGSHSLRVQISPSSTETTLSGNIVITGTSASGNKITKTISISDNGMVIVYVRVLPWNATEIRATASLVPRSKLTVKYSYYYSERTLHIDPYNLYSSEYYPITQGASAPRVISVSPERDFYHIYKIAN